MNKNSETPWQRAVEISDVHAVHEALVNLCNDHTEDNAAGVIIEVLKAAATPAEKFKCDRAKHELAMVNLANGFESEEFGFAQEMAMQYGASHIDPDANVLAITAKDLYVLMTVLGYSRNNEASGLRYALSRVKYEATSLGDAQVIALEALEPKAGKYTVTLLYPDYVADNFGQDTYVDHVEAASPQEAARVAQEKVTATVPDVEDPNDFFVISVFEGHLEDLK